MAEIGLIASVIQVAGAGLKLSQTLYQYADTVANADRRIKDIAKEVQLTSFVIDELGHIFNQDQSSTILSKNAIKTADETVKECSTVFQELDAALKKTKKNTLGRLMLPFRESKIDLLRNHIDKLKSTLQLLMQVLTHAHQIASQKLDREAEAEQREQIKQLLQNKKKSTKKYEESLKNYTGSDEESDKENENPKTSKDLLITASSISSSITTKSLATCVQHIQGLLDDIENLQQALSDEKGGNDPSEHHQSLVGSYFRARGHLDSVLLGNPTSGAESEVAGSETTSLRRSEMEFSIRRELTGSTLQATESRKSGEIVVQTSVAKPQHEWLGMSEKDFDVAFKAAILKAQEDARREEREKLANAETKERQNAEEEARRALEAARKADEVARKAKEAARQAADEMVERVRAEVKAKADLDAEAKAAREREPIKFEDAMGRKFTFPFIYVSTWPGMRRLIDEAFSTVSTMKPYVDELQYDLLDPSGETILPTCWAFTVKPGWTITMRMKRGYELESILKRQASESKHTDLNEALSIPLVDTVPEPLETETAIQIPKTKKTALVAEAKGQKRPRVRRPISYYDASTKKPASPRFAPPISRSPHISKPPAPAFPSFIGETSTHADYAADPLFYNPRSYSVYQPSYTYPTAILPYDPQKTTPHFQTPYAQYPLNPQYSRREQPAFLQSSSDKHDTKVDDGPRRASYDDSFDEDIDFAATIAAGLQGGGFDPNLSYGDATSLSSKVEQKRASTELMSQDDQRQYVKHLKRNPSLRKLKGIEKELEFVKVALSCGLLDNKTWTEFETREEKLRQVASELNANISKTGIKNQNTMSEPQQKEKVEEVSEYTHEMFYHPGISSNRPLAPPPPSGFVNYSDASHYTPHHYSVPERGRYGHDHRRASPIYNLPAHFGSDESDVEAAAGLAALRMADEYDKAQDALGPSPTSCIICGKQGHIARDCSRRDDYQQRQPDYAGGYGGNRLICFSCGGLDHSNDDCPKGQKCWNCGQIGHTARTCTVTAIQRPTVVEETNRTEAHADDANSVIDDSNELWDPSLWEVNMIKKETEDQPHRSADDRELAKPENAPPRKEEEILNQEEQQIEDREEEIRNIEKSMAELNDLFRDVGQITSEQGEQLGSISENIATFSNSGVTPSASKGKEDEDEVRQRRRAQNKLAQRKFREKARERREYNMKAEASTQYNQRQNVESEDLGDSELSGLLWGSVSMRHVIARGHNSSARRTSPYMAHPETSQTALQMEKSRTPSGNVPKGNSGSQKQVRFDFGLEQGSVQTEIVKPRLDLHISDSVARAIQSTKQTEQQGQKSDTSVGFSEGFALPSDLHPLSLRESSVRPKSRFESFFDHQDDQRDTSDDSQQVPQSAWDNLLEKLAPRRPRNRDLKATGSTGNIASFEHGDTDTGGNNEEVKNQNLTEDFVDDKNGKGNGPSNERPSQDSDAGAKVEGAENEVDDEVDELLKEWTTVLG